MTENPTPKAENWEQANKWLREFDKIIQKGKFNSPKKGEKIHVGVDLGTSSILTIVLGEDMRPLAGLMEYAKVVRDGVVYDFLNARRIVGEQKARMEEFLGMELTHAAAAIPPGVNEGNVKAVEYVLEGVDYECSSIVDESTAAATVLGVKDGAVVDVGGGTTGISVMKDGKVEFSADEPTGGHHITLVLSGSLGIPYDDAEIMKRDVSRHREIYPVVRPVADKMAAITGKYIAGRGVEEVYVVGGACVFEQFAPSFSEVLDLPVFKPECPWLVTPMGIAMHDEEA